MKTAVATLLVAGVCAACDSSTRLPAAPSPGGADPAFVQGVHAEWSPYIGVHASGVALAAYQDALAALVRAGRVKGVRVEIRKAFQSPSDSVIKAIGATGVELLALIGNEYLFEPDIEDQIDRIFAAYPEIRHFQIGNEATTILPPTGPTIGIAEYMAVFQRIYDHVQRRHAGRATLLTQSTIGFGLYGPMELETMANLGLAAMDPSKVIVAINAYDPDAASQYVGLLGGQLRKFRVWVTESGVSDPTRHTSFVQLQYPLLRNYLRAERVYWYVLWGGDEGTDVDFSLIKNPTSYPHYWKSPLFKLLAGQN